LDRSHVENPEAKTSDRRSYYTWERLAIYSFVPDCEAMIRNTKKIATKIST